MDHKNAIQKYIDENFEAGNGNMFWQIDTPVDVVVEFFFDEFELDGKNMILMEFDGWSLEDYFNNDDPIHSDCISFSSWEDAYNYITISEETNPITQFISETTEEVWHCG